MLRSVYAQTIKNFLRKPVSTRPRRLCSNEANKSAKDKLSGINVQRRGPVTYATLGVTVLVGAGLLVYYNIEKEKKADKVAGEITTTGMSIIL